MVVTDTHGTHCVYASGKQGTSYEKDEHTSSSYRWDVIGLGANNYKSIEFHVYIAWSNPSGDEWGCQLGGGRHSDGSNPRCYVLGIDNKSGATRLRVEDSHPNYDEVGDGSSGVGLSSKPCGGSFIKRNVSGGVLCEIWQDAGNNNGWKRLLSIVEKNKNWQQPPSDHMIVFRMDEGDLDSIQLSKFCYREILDSDPTTAFGGTGTGTPPSGGGGSGGGTGDNDDDDTGGDTGGETGGEPEPPPEPDEPDPVIPEIYTVQKVFSYSWNVITPADSCNQTEPTMSRQLDEYYTVPSTTGDYWDLYGGVPKTVITRVGLLVMMDLSALNGEIFRQFVPVCKRVGAPTGDIFLRIYDDKGTLVYTCPNSVIANSLGLNDTEPIFQDFRCEIQIKLGYRIAFTYEGGDSANYVRMAYNRTDAVDGLKTIMTYWVDNKWTNDPNQDTAIKLYV